MESYGEMFCSKFAYLSKNGQKRFEHNSLRSEHAVYDAWKKKQKKIMCIYNNVRDANNTRDFLLNLTYS